MEPSKSDLNSENTPEPHESDHLTSSTQRPETTSVEPLQPQTIQNVAPQAQATSTVIQPNTGTASPAFSQPTVPAVPSSPSPSQFFQPDQPKVVASSFGTPAQPAPAHSRMKAVLLIGAPLVLTLLLGTGFVFGYYLPTRPENVWKTGLDRSGMAVDKLVIAATETKKLESYKKSQVSATVDVNSGSGTYGGSFDAKFDASKLNGNISFASQETGAEKQEFSLNVLSQLNKDSTYPNVYFQLNGLKLLGADLFVPGISDYDGKWIAVEEAYLKSLGESVDPQLKTENQQKHEITATDYAELTRAFTKTTKDYVLTGNSDKAVLENRKFIAKETSDGLNVYHYKAGVNKAHAKTYCKALVENILATAAYKKLFWVEEKNIEKDKTTFTKDCQDSMDDIKSSDTFDVWIDSKYKLIHKVRVYEEGSTTAYTDFGQTYKGDDDLSLFAIFHDDTNKTEGKLTVETSLKTDTSKGLLSYKGGEGDNAYDIKVTFTAKPYTGEIKVDKPANAISIAEVLQKFGVDPATLFGGSGASTGSDGTVFGDTQSKAKDSERKADINHLMAYTEAYYAENGFYPTFNNLNSASWRTANMKGLDPEALKDPDGSSASLKTVPTAKFYAYQPTGCSAQGCTGYTFTAQLDTGETYVKQNL